VKPICIINKARDDGVAVASDGPYANHLHLAPERQLCQHLIARFFIGRMPFLARYSSDNYVKALADAQFQNIERIKAPASNVL